MASKNELKEKMISFIRRLPESGWVFSTSGNMSVRCEDGTILITPSSVPYETMTPEDIFELNSDGEIIKKGKNVPTSSLRFHVALMKERQDCNCVFHTHAQHCLAASLVTDHVPAVTLNEMLLLGKDGINVSPYAENGSEEEAANIVKAVGKNNNCCLMQNHGVITLGADIESAWVNMGYAEDCCKVWLLAESTGRKLTSIT